MKIAISGAQSVGKTTLLNSLKQTKEFKDFQFVGEITRELQKRGFKINESGDDDTQIEIIKAHLRNSKLEGNIIYDRCSLDGLVYTHYLFINGKVSEKVLKKAEKFFFISFKKYNLICYIKPEFEIEDDNVRSNSKDFQNSIVLLFEHYINKYDLKPLILKGTIEERVNQLKQLNIKKGE